MSLFVTSLNSGSNGNCYYIANSSEAILVDVGISCREVEKRMKRLELSLQKVKAIFISHEHSDHIRGVEVLAKKFNLPVYITESTLRFSRLRLEADLVNCFQPHIPVHIGSLNVKAFPKLHDAVDAHSFIIECNDLKVGVLTDIGSVCSNVTENFRQCNAVFLEANYDEQMLENGNYPYHLKKRISDGRGHLSNRQALDLFIKHKSPLLTHIFLSHLSKDNNSPELVEQLFMNHAENTRVVIASRYQETEVFSINKSFDGDSKTFRIKPAVQMSLFND